MKAGQILKCADQHQLEKTAQVKAELVKPELKAPENLVATTLK